MQIWYHDDLDGRCAAVIAASTATTGELVQFTPYQHGMDMNKPMGRIRKDERMFILDMAPAEADALFIMSVTQNLTLIDHHASTLKLPYIAELGSRAYLGNSDNCWSAAMLTWRYCYPKLAATPPHAVILVSDYDTWQWRNWKNDEARSFHEGARMFDLQPWSDDFQTLLQLNPELPGKGQVACARLLLTNIITTGKVCLKYRDALFNELRPRFERRVQFEGYKCRLLPFNLIGSQAFGSDPHSGMVIAYNHLGGERASVSLYTDGLGIDVGLIAAKYGGGGHRGAAGFIWNGPGWPWTEVKEVMSQ